MKKNSKHEDTSVPSQAEPDIAVLMAKMQQQLVILEKKIDSLISQSWERPFKVEHDSRHFQRFDRFRRNEKRDQGNSYRQRQFTQAICADCHKECEVPFKPSGDRPVYCKDCFSRRKQGGSFKAEFDKAPRTEGDFTPTHRRIVGGRGIPTEAKRNVGKRRKKRRHDL